MAEKVSTGGRGGLFPFTLLFGALYASFGVMSPFLPTLLQDRGLTAKEIGVVLALSTVARLVSGPLAGRTADLLAALRPIKQIVQPAIGALQPLSVFRNQVS
jgi:PPP family 3-phenylpropionic acid transporter